MTPPPRPRVQERLLLGSQPQPLQVGGVEAQILVNVQAGRAQAGEAVCRRCSSMWSTTFIEATRPAIINVVVHHGRHPYFHLRGLWLNLTETGLTGLIGVILANRAKVHLPFTKLENEFTCTLFANCYN